ncbi:hypothetical protein NDU88_002602 [Pleurodeles waltl]|uniref:Uncharacterized protein n=1 Tax=Pleurodeles waltl TaxID=8319 RepID=A0AAV7MPW8_PLEWA|nr:hypothetical protein NDU88_002602 [Pleurodeles waltl]
MGKEGGDGHSAGKQVLGWLTKAGCTINAGAVRDGKDPLRGAEPDYKPRDKLQRIMPARPFQRRRTEEPTGKRTTGTGGEHEEATAGGFRRYREEDGTEDPIPSRSRPLDKDCWPQGALA